MRRGRDDDRGAVGRRAPAARNDATAEISCVVALVEADDVVVHGFGFAMAELNA